MNTYKSVTGKSTGKGVCRREITNAIGNSNTSKGKILSLPNVNFFIEQMILSEVSKKYSIVAVECHKPTYYKMLQTIINLELDGITTHQGFLSEMIYGQNENAYSHIIADYCGTLQKHAKELEYALKNKIVEVDGTISITLTERIVKKVGLKFERKTIKGFKKIKGIVRTEQMLRCFVETHGNNNFEIENVVRYHDKKPINKKKGANMILMILRRIK